MADQATHPDVEVKPGKGAAAGRPLAGVLDMWTGMLAFVGEVTLLTGQTCRSIVRSGIDFKDLLTQMALIGADSIWIVLVITSATGAVFALYTTTLAMKIGFTQFVGGTVSYGFLNELGPLLGGIAFASRAGAAIAAEIGSMVVTEQVDALRSMAISPVRYLVVPRVLASIIMLPLLTVLADVAGVYGGYLFSVAKGVTSQTFLDSMRQYTVTADLYNGLIKSVVFGFLVGTVACHQGLKTKGGATGVGRATTSSVVLCVVLIFIADFFLAQIFTARDTGRQASRRWEPWSRPPRIARGARPDADPERTNLFGSVALVVTVPASGRR